MTDVLAGVSRAASASLHPGDGDAPGGDSFATSGPSPTTVHLLGLGKVGRALLRQLDGRFRVVGATDSTGTVYRTQGLDPEALVVLKQRGQGVRALGGERLPLPLAVQIVRSDVVVDCLPTEPAGAARAVERLRAAHAAGRAAVVAGKSALCHGGPELLEALPDLGVNAALGGTGGWLRADLPLLRGQCREIVCVPNATTTVVLAAIEAGGTQGDGIVAARAAGLLETDPTLDLDGTDAALKLAIVASWVFGRRRTLAEVELPGACAVTPAVLRERRGRGAVTRLVGRATRQGSLSLAWEELPPGAPLAVPPGRVAYGYRLQDGSLRLHVGAGVGPQGTASAVLADLLALRGVLALRGELAVRGEEVRS